MKLQTELTHYNIIAIEASYLYCFCIRLLINRKTPQEAFSETFEEVKRRASISGDSTIRYWFEKCIETDGIDEMPLPNERPITYLKTALLWSFYYLKNEWSFHDAIKDIIAKQGDVEINAAVVGGMLGAAYGTQAIDNELIDKVFRLEIQDRLDYTPRSTLKNLVHIALATGPSRLEVRWDSKTLKGQNVVD